MAEKDQQERNFATPTALRRAVYSAHLEAQEMRKRMSPEALDDFALGWAIGMEYAVGLISQSVPKDFVAEFREMYGAAGAMHPDHGARLYGGLPT